MIAAPMDWQTEQKNRRLSGLSFLEGAPSRERVFAVIVDTLRTLPTDRSDSNPETFRSHAISATAAALREANLPEWAAALEARAGIPQHPVEPILSAAEILLGRACGRLCGSDVSEENFRLVRSVREVIAFGSDDFLSAAHEALLAEESSAKTLTCMLRQRALDYPHNPDAVAYIFSSDRHTLIGNRPVGRILDAWDGPSRIAMVQVHDFDAYELLRRLDRVAYLRLLEDHPLRELAFWALEGADRNASVAELCELLIDARAGFDSRNEWIPENTVVFRILKILGDRLLLLFPEGGESDAPSAKFKEGMEQILTALDVRGDAVPLGHAWFQYLIMTGGGGRRQWLTTVPAAETIPKALAYIATNLAAHLAQHPDPMGWVSGENEPWRDSRVYTLLAFELCRQSQDIGVMSDLLEKVLLGDVMSSYGVHRLLSHPSVERWVVGNVVALIPDPAQWFRQLWDRLFWQRDRTRFFHTSGQIPPDVGQIIVCWALCGLDSLGAGSDAARALWLQLEQAVREASLTAVFRQHDDTWSHALRLLGGYWHKTFPEDPPQGEPGSLDDFIAPWRQVDGNFAMLVQILHRYDVPPARLKQAIRSGEILRIITRETKVMGRSLFSEQEVKSILAIADEIDGIGQSPC